MPFFKPRRKSTRSSRLARRGEDLQKLYIQVTSPRIVMFQVLRGIGKSIKIILVLALIGMIGWAGYLGVRHVFIDNEDYRLQNIVIRPAGGSINHARVVTVGDIDLNASIFAIDTESVRNRLFDLPEVTHCEVERRLPGTLLITLKERLPIAWLQSEQSQFPGKTQGGVLADAEGVTFPCEGALWQTSQNLPVIIIKDEGENAFNHGQKMKHPEVIRALHLIQKMSTVDLRADWAPEKVTIMNNYSIQIVCNDSSRAVFGMYGHDRQLADFISVREHTLSSGRKIKHVNLIPEKNIPVTFVGEPVLVKPRKKLEYLNAHGSHIEPLLNRN